MLTITTSNRTITAKIQIIYTSVSTVVWAKYNYNVALLLSTQLLLYEIFTLVCEGIFLCSSHVNFLYFRLYLRSYAYANENGGVFSNIPQFCTTREILMNLIQDYFVSWTLGYLSALLSRGKKNERKNKKLFIHLKEVCWNLFQVDMHVHDIHKIVVKKIHCSW